LFRHFTQTPGAAWLFEALNNIEFIEQALHRMLFEEIVILHLLFNIGQIYQGHKFNKQFAIKAQFGRNQCPAQI